MKKIISSTFSMILLVPLLALSVHGQPASSPAVAQPGNLINSLTNSSNTSRMNPAFLLASEMNVFRLSAGAMTVRALDVWASPEFLVKWIKEVWPLFPKPEDRRQVEDFFSSAVVLLGRTANGSGVAGFYSPWQDGLLLIAATPGKEHPLLTDFCFIAGETWRGEKVATGEDLLALYALKEPLTIALSRHYAATIEKFNRLYPVQAQFVFLPEELKRELGPTSEELAPIKGRMLYRAQMFRKLFEKENRAAVQVAKELRSLLAAGDLEKLRAYLSPKQNAEMLDTVCKMPVVLRRNLAPNYFVRNPSAGGSIMALVNSEMPRWIFAVQILDKTAGEKPGVTIEALDLGSSALVINEAKNNSK